MLFPDFKFLADENISFTLIDLLRKQNVSVLSLNQASLTGKSDWAIIDYAYKHELIILTQDQDFGRLIYANNFQFHGIVYLRPGHFSAEHHLETMIALLQLNENITTPFIIVALNEKNTIKIRLRNNLLFEK